MSKIRLHGTSSGYTEIAPVAASGNNTLTLPNDGTIISKDAAGAVGVTSIKSSNVNVGAAVTITESGIEASGIGITCANINGTQIGGRRNIIINGAMQVAQRATSYTGTNNYATVDRFRLGFGGTDENPTQSQVDVASGTTPYTLGFRKAYRITNGNQTSGFDAGDFLRVDTILEAQNLANSGWNYTSASSYITLSYWVKSSVSQEFFGYLYTADGSNYKYGWSLGSLSANTWTKVIKTIPGNSNITIDNNNDQGCWLNLLGIWGTNYTASDATPNTWMTWDGSKRSTDQASTWYTTNDATFEITGVQLEVGSQATAFEHRTFSEELALCQRYYQVISSPTTSTLGFYGNNGNFYAAGKSFHTQMRTTPSTSTYQYDGAGTNYWVEPGIQAFSANSTTGITLVSTDNSFYFYQPRQAGNSNAVRNTTYVWEPAWSGIFEAEL